MNLAKCGKCGKKWDDETQSLACPHRPRIPKALEAIADIVLNYRPKAKQPKPRKRKKAKHSG